MIAEPEGWQTKRAPHENMLLARSLQIDQSLTAESLTRNIARDLEVLETTFYTGDFSRHSQ